MFDFFDDQLINMMNARQPMYEDIKVVPYSKYAEAANELNKARAENEYLKDANSKLRTDLCSLSIAYHKDIANASREDETKKLRELKEENEQLKAELVELKNVQWANMIYTPEQVDATMKENRELKSKIQLMKNILYTNGETNV